MEHVLSFYCHIKFTSRVLQPGGRSTDLRYMYCDSSEPLLKWLILWFMEGSVLASFLQRLRDLWALSIFIGKEFWGSSTQEGLSNSRNSVSVLLPSTFFGKPEIPGSPSPLLLIVSSLLLLQVGKLCFVKLPRSFFQFHTVSFPCLRLS